MAKKELKKFLVENKFTVSSDLINDYTTNLKDYLQKINVAISKNESEEHLKGILKDFLKDNFYNETKYSINTSNFVDAAISKDNKLQVLIEIKKPSNTLEMITEANFNKKALWEIVLYYIEATRYIKDGKVKRNPDSEIKNLVITDCKKFFVFDSQKVESIVKGELEKFWEKKETSQLISKNKDIFYDKAKDFFEKQENTSKLDYVYFDIEELAKTKTGITSSYKMLSKQILLKDNASKITASPLNAAFYQELLYILGLKEVKEGGKTLIKINFDVKNTFAVQVYNYLKEDKSIFDENEVIDKTFSAIIVWTNRLLFIKLFEGQLLAINGEKPEYRILDNEKIQSENDLQNLFFQILGTKDRKAGEFFDKFKYIPYLNSSLFENYDVEKNDVMIRDIDNSEVVVKPNSKTKKTGKLKLIEYVIDFLNSYNFSSVSVEESETSSGKEIIDAAVLGLIFEKINGYKDGSYYTPSNITEYICKETIESAIIQKVNEFYKQDLKTFDDLILFSSDISKKKQINEIINSLKICDPAVGSGHFLVSALNRIIAIKSELGVLFYHNENRLLTDCDIRVVNDVLTITDGNGEQFAYNRASMGSFKVQKTIFCEKRLIIENCLFGVDINDKAVSICQLRLWIELLKNAYYENNVMETLPNIDINIKCGNSLVHKLPVEVGKKLSSKSDKDLKKYIAEYKQRVNSYKHESNKANKEQIKFAINRMKGILHQSSVQNSMDFIEDQIDYDELKLMKTGFEWAIEFPEVLADDGTFLGFDCVIGNPPYGIKFTSAEKKYLSKNFQSVPDYESADYFIYVASDLLKQAGLLGFIVPNTFLANHFATSFRESMLKTFKYFNMDDLSNWNVFESASVRNVIIMFSKTLIKTGKFTSLVSENGHMVRAKQVNIDSSMLKSRVDNWLNLILIDNERQQIIDKIKKGSKPLIEYCSISQGLIPYDKYRGHSEETIKNKIWNADHQKDSTFKKELQGKDVSRYHLEWNGKDWLSYGSWLAAPRRKEFFTEERILIREITNPRILATITDEEYYNTPSIINCIEFEVSPFYLLGLINSKLFTFYHLTTSPKANKGLFPKILVSDIKKLPVKVVDEYVVRLAQLVKEQLDNYSCEKDELIDNMVYDLYGLTKEEISCIESMIKPME
ncbi:MAG: hypothetical protein E7344_03275 [Clostridiales bacterium]|nr:hypothetical protein [Clostridiales bacterium]